MDIEIRPAQKDELPRFNQAVALAFGGRMDEEESVSWAESTEADRTLMALDGTEIVATAAAASFQLTLPGAALVPAAGVAAVGVRPTHRRRGLLSLLMERQLDDVAERGEAVAILTASESVIYRRFGYGAATFQTGVAVETQRSAFHPPLDDPGSVHLITNDEALSTLPDIHDRARRLQSGDITRPRQWWQRACGDPSWVRSGRGPAFFALHRAPDGHADGWAIYRIKSRWNDALANHVVEVEDLAGITPEAELALWRYLLDIDLVGEVRSWTRPTDEPIRHRLADPRRFRTNTVRDDLWVRLVDIPAALSSRRYLTDAELVIEVTDSFRPQSAGRYLLSAGTDGAECKPTRKQPDLSMDVAVLGSAYLGNPRFTLQSAAGLVEEHRFGALAAADIAFRSADIPFCRTGF